MSHRIRVLDVECSDLEPPAAKVIEVGLCDVMHLGTPDGSWSIAAPVSWLCDPQGPIAPGARAAHHIRADDLAGRPPFNPAEIDTGNVPVDLFAAHNAAYEQRFYTTEKRWICTYKAALRTFPDAPTHSNFGLLYYLEDHGLIAPYPREMTQPSHRAGPDSFVTAMLLVALLKLNTAATMAKWTLEPALLPRCPIGEQWRGKPWSEVDRGFLEWCLRKPDMDAEIKWNVERELFRRSQ